MIFGLILWILILCVHWYKLNPEAQSLIRPKRDHTEAVGSGGGSSSLCEVWWSVVVILTLSSRCPCCRVFTALKASVFDLSPSFRQSVQPQSPGIQTAALIRPSLLWGCYRCLIYRKHQLDIQFMGLQLKFDFNAPHPHPPLSSFLSLSSFIRLMSAAPCWLQPH